MVNNSCYVTKHCKYNGNTVQGITNQTWFCVHLVWHLTWVCCTFPQSMQYMEQLMNNSWTWLTQITHWGLPDLFTIVPLEFRQLSQGCRVVIESCHTLFTFVPFKLRQLDWVRDVELWLSSAILIYFCAFQVEITWLSQSPQGCRVYFWTIIGWSLLLIV